MTKYDKVVSTVSTLDFTASIVSIFPSEVNKYFDQLSD